ncbi:MAG TPA: hypothetical protein VEN78_27755 [Bradyrhizobium sp.]|nr:hypothetical protein [Bradyrhizobium sp.]
MVQLIRGWERIVVLAIYLGILAYLTVTDWQASVLWALAPPLAFLLLRESYRRGLVATTAFCALFLISHGLGPSLFFLDRDVYAFQGWGAVGNFSFTLTEMLPQYAFVFLLMAVIVGGVILLQFVTGLRLRSIQSGIIVFPPVPTARRWEMVTAAVAGAASLLSAFMFDSRIGMTGIEPPALPFHLSGGLFYLRFAVVPVMLFICYRYSHRSPPFAALILAYAAIAGLASVSKSTLVVSAAPVLFFALNDRQYLRLAISIAWLMILYSVISFSRDLVYFGDAGNFLFYVINLDLLRGMSGSVALAFLDGAANRLYGSQDVVLAHQYNVGDQMQAMVNLFSARPVVEDVAGEIFGLNLYETSFGVGMGLFAWLIVAAKGEFFVGIVEACLVAFLLFISEVLVRKLANSRRFPGVVALPFGFAVAFELYIANLLLFYWLLAGVAVFILINSVVREALLSVREEYSKVLTNARDNAAAAEQPH